MNTQNKRWYDQTWSQQNIWVKALTIIVLNVIILGGIIWCVSWYLSTYSYRERVFTNILDPYLDEHGKVKDYYIYFPDKVIDVACSKFNDKGNKVVIPCREGDELVMLGMKYWDMMAAQFGRPCDCNCKSAEKPILVSSKQVSKKVENGQACRTMLREYSDGHAEVEYQKFMAVNLANHEELWMTLTENCDSFLAKFAPTPNLTYSITSVMDDRSCVRCCKEKEEKK